MTFNEQVLNTLPALKGFALSIVRNHSKAEDIVQDVVVKALANKDKFEEGSNIRAWLFTILRNEVYSQHRKVARMTYTDFEFVTPILPNQDIQIFWNEVSSVIEQMPEAHKRALILVTVEGYTYEEVAEMENVPNGTIKSRVFRARQFLNENLALPDVDGISAGVISNDDNFRTSYSR